jgi:hypothetical protein
VTGRLLEMHRKPIAERCDRLTEPDLLALVAEAIQRACGSQKAAAIDMNAPQSQVCRWLSGVEPLRLGQLTRSEAVLREFAFLLAAKCGHDVRRITPNEQRRRRIVEINRELLELMQQEERAS